MQQSSPPHRHYKSSTTLNFWQGVIFLMSFNLPSVNIVGMHWQVVLFLFRLITELVQKGYCLSRYSSAESSRSFLYLFFGDEVFSLALLCTGWNNLPPITPCRFSGLWMLHVVFFNGANQPLRISLFNNFPLTPTSREIDSPLLSRHNNIVHC